MQFQKQEKGEAEKIGDDADQGAGGAGPRTED
jgi:hypothetical protein